MVGRPASRRKYVARMAHRARDLDPRWARKLSSSLGRDAIEALLRKAGAPEACYVLSEDRAVDGRILPLGDALALVVADDSPAFVSCVPGRLGLYSDEAPDGEWLLRRGDSSA